MSELVWGQQCVKQNLAIATQIISNDCTVRLQFSIIWVLGGANTLLVGMQECISLSNVKMKNEFFNIYIYYTVVSREHIDIATISHVSLCRLSSLEISYSVIEQLRILVASDGQRALQKPELHDTKTYPNKYHVLVPIRSNCRKILVEKL